MLFLLAGLSVWTYAAHSDLRHFQVPNHVWLALGTLGGVRALVMPVSHVAVSASVLVLCPLAILLWSRYDFGGADAKALMVGSILYPEAIAVFLVGTGVCFVPFEWAGFQPIPAIVAFAGGATMATLMLLVA